MMRLTKITAVAIFFFVAIAFGVSAQNPFNISFPVAELGNCGSIDECKAYCDDSANSGACLDFAEKNGLMKKQEIETARKIIGKTGPGGCQGVECKKYCSDENNQNECFEFAAQEGLIAPEEVKKIRDIKEKTGSIQGPGGCKGETECRQYCENPNNLQECLDFSVKAGFMTQEEASKIRGIAGKGPGGCKGERACHNYCEDPEHGEECLAFAEEHDLMSKEELQLAKKLINKDGPGGCKGQTCQKYCENSDNADVCLEFAEKQGLLPKEEIERARKFTNIEGPGGCKGFKCKEYCENPSNQEACFEFAKKQGLIPVEEIQKIERGRQLQQEVEKSGGPGGCKDENSCRDYCSDTARTDECLNFAVEKGAFSKEEAKQQLEQFTKFREFGEKIRSNPGEFGNSRFDSKQMEEQFRKQIKDFGSEGFDPAKLEQQFKSSGNRFGPQGFMPEGVLPEGVDIKNLNPKEIEQQIRKQFESQGRGGGSQFPGRSRSFPGQTPSEFPSQGKFEQFPGQSDEFPGGPNFKGDEREGGSNLKEGNLPQSFHPPSAEDIQKFGGFRQQENQPEGKGFQQEKPNQQIQPGVHQEFQRQVQQEFQNQVQQQTQQQFQREFNRQIEQQSGTSLQNKDSFSPQSGNGSFGPPPSSEGQGSFQGGGGSFGPSSGGGGSFNPPPSGGSGSFGSPPSGSGGGGSFGPPPGTFAPTQPLGFILGPVLNIFR